jgi:hypothetical protein
MIRHLPYLDPERWYLIDVDHGEKEGRPRWQHRAVSLHGPSLEASASWTLLGSYNFGWGFQLGRNGMESDLGLDVHAGRLGSVWLRLRSPWTKWARIPDRRPGWYHPRHTGIVFGPFGGERPLTFIVRVQLDSASDAGRDGRREWSLTWWKIVGRSRTDTEVTDSGTYMVELPEGLYAATWEAKTNTTRHVRWPGTWLDAIRGPKVTSHVSIDVPGGIPVEGKGENSWDCGMDGVLSTSGATLDEAVANLVRAVMRDRSRYGGPHDLPHPMTIAEAATRAGER